MLESLKRLRFAVANKRTARLVRKSMLTILGLSLVQAGATLTWGEGNWPQWRGPNRDGIAAPQALLKAWPAEGPKLAWSYTNNGAGYSSVAVVDGKLYTMGKLDGKATAICLNSSTGAKLWETPFGSGAASYNVGWGDGPRSTPTIDGDRVYCLSDMGTIACLNRNTGEKLWSRELVADLNGKVPVWGYSESVLIDGNRVVVTPGGPSLLVGLDKLSGEKTWSSKASYEAQYVSVMKAVFDGVPVYLTASKPGLVGIHAETGEELFLNAKTGNGVAVIPTPVISGNRVYHSSGYGAGNLAVDISVSNGKLNAKEVYYHGADTKSSMENHHGGFILHDGTIYGFSRKGGVWMAQDLKTGDTLWTKKIGKAGSGSIGMADGMLYCYDDKEGICYLVKPSRTGWEQLGSVKLPEEASIDRGKGAIWAHPVIAEKKLFIRDQDKLFAFDIAQ